MGGLLSRNALKKTPQTRGLLETTENLGITSGGQKSEVKVFRGDVLWLMAHGGDALGGDDPYDSSRLQCYLEVLGVL